MNPYDTAIDALEMLELINPEQQHRLAMLATGAASWKHLRVYERACADLGKEQVDQLLWLGLLRWVKLDDGWRLGVTRLGQLVARGEQRLRNRQPDLDRAVARLRERAERGERVDLEAMEQEGEPAGLPMSELVRAWRAAEPRPVAVLHDHPDGVDDDDTPPATPGAAAQVA